MYEMEDDNEDGEVEAEQITSAICPSPIPGTLRLEDIPDVMSKILSSVQETLGPSTLRPEDIPDYMSKILSSVQGTLGPNTLLPDGYCDVEAFPAKTPISTQGCPGPKTLDLKIQMAQKVFIKTQSFQRVKEILKQFGYVTISGASGEGKTTMALMIANSYIPMGYRIAFVEDIETFDLDDCLSSYKKLFFIFDDIFGSAEPFTNAYKQKKFLDRLFLHLQNSKTGQDSEDKQKKEAMQTVKEETETTTDDMPHIRKDKKYSRNILTVFTSKTYNLDKGLSNVQSLQMSLFKKLSILDITKSAQWKYTPEEKRKIYAKHKERHKSSNFKEEFDVDRLLHIEEDVFGFPLLCKLYFELPSFYERNIDFFKKPLHYLREEISMILMMRNDRSSALIFMMLFQENMDLSKIEIDNNDEQVELWIQAVRDIVPCITRTGICTAAREFRGTFFSEGDTISFAHESIYDACACALCKLNPGFVLKHCSLRFLTERVTTTGLKETRVVEEKHEIFLSKNYHDQLLSRLVEAILNGHFSKTFTHPILKKKEMIDQLFDKVLVRIRSSYTKKPVILEHDHDVVDKHHILYWAVHAQSDYLLKTLMNTVEIMISPKTVKDECILEACASCGNKDALQYFISQVRPQQNMLDKLMLIAAENVRTDIVLFLNEKKANIKATDNCRRNILHLSCLKGNDKLVKHLKQFPEQFPVFQELLDSEDADGRLPIMTSVMTGNHEIFKLLFEVSDIRKTTQKVDVEGNNLLHLACKSGNKDVIESLIPKINVNSRGANGMTPGMIALQSNAYDMFKLLVENKTDLTMCDDYGRTFLHYAAECGVRDIVESLLFDSLINRQDMGGKTPIMVAASEGNNEAFEVLSSQPNVNLSLLHQGDNLLHLACQGGYTGIVKKMLKLFDINSKGHKGRTPIMVSVLYGHKTVFCLLRKREAKLTGTDVHGDSLFHLACKGGNADIVELMNIKFINVKGNHEWTPIMAAAAEGNFDVFRLLYDHKANLSNRDDRGDSLLHLASRGGNTSIVQCVLNHFPIDLKGREGLTPIMQAAEGGKWGVFKLLFAKKAKLSIIGANGLSLLHCAVIGGNTTVQQHILSCWQFRGYTNKRKLLEPLLMAARNGNERVFNLLSSYRSILPTTKEAATDLFWAACEGGMVSVVKTFFTRSFVNERDENGRTPLMIAAARGHHGLFELMVSHGSNLHLVDKFGDNILHLACQGGNINIVKHVLSLSNVNSKGRHGWTPIMKAAFKGFNDVFDLLLESRADIRIAAKNKDSVLHLACVGGSQNIAERLLAFLNTPGDCDWTPVMKTAAEGFTDMYKFLVTKKADLSLVDRNGDGILHLACQGKSSEIIEHMLSNTDFLFRKGRKGWTPLMKAAVTGDKKVFNMMFSVLKKNKRSSLENTSLVSLKMIDNNGDSLLHLACQGGNYDIVKRVLKHIRVDIPGQYNWTPAMNATYFGNNDMLDLLIANGANLTLLSEYGEDILSIARRGKDQKLHEYLMSKPAVRPLLRTKQKGRHKLSTFFSKFN